MPGNTTYPIKHTKIDQFDLPIVLQTTNGPCFLIALVNSIILKISSGKLTTNLSEPSLSEAHHLIAKLQDSKYVTEKDLLDFLGGCIFESEDPRLQKKDHLVTALSYLNFGLTLNPKMDTILVDNYYELTDPIKNLLWLFGISLYHGFIMDDDLQRKIKPDSLDLTFDYCQDLRLKLMEEDPNDILPDLQRFFNINNTQLTPLGMSLLETMINPNEIGIFFRNDHFSTFLKGSDDDKLYLLVTDAGVKDLPEIMWQQLTINDDGDFLTSEFSKIQFDDDQLANLHADPINNELSNIISDSHDSLIAKQLQVEEDERQAKLLQAQFNKQAKQTSTVSKPKPISSNDKKPKQKSSISKKNDISSKKKSCIIM